MRNIVAVAVENLDVTYDGPALVDHTMDVRALAPSLLALADAFQVAQAALDPNLEPPTLHIVANPRAGSFIVEIVVNSALLVQHVLTSGPSTAAANAGGLVASVKYAMSAIKWLRNRDATALPQPEGTVRYVTADGDSLEIPAEASTILETPKFRAEINAVVQPVRRPGITSLRIENQGGDKTPVVIEPVDVQSFDLPRLELEEGTVVSQRTILVNIVTVQFRNNLRWKLNDGSNTFTATLNDPHFLARVHRREVSFAEGDQLRVVLEETQTRDPVTGRLSTSRSIDRVLDHIQAPVQGQLFGSGDEQ